jgi:hypothetical protein
LYIPHVMTKAALLLTVLAAACTDDPIAEQRETPTTPIPARPTASVEGHALIVATGGAAAVVIEDRAAIGFSGDATPGYAVEPYELDRWPNTISPEYWIRAHVAGTGAYEIVTSKGIATGLVHSADVARVAVLPASYELADASAPFAVAPNRTALEAALFDAQGRRLVDATLALGADGATQTAWDRAALAAATGIHTLTAAADSFGERTYAIEVVDGADRIEQTRAGDRTCFHAYRGTTEVVIAMTIEGGTPDPRSANCAIVAAGADPDALRVRY